MVVDTVQGRQRVVVIGSGFGGLFATKALRKEDVDITVIDRTAQHLFQPLLYQVATGILSPGEIAPSTREILRRQKNSRVLLGEVTDIDLAAHEVTSVAGSIVRRTSYDTLIVAAGASQSYFGNDHFAEFAPGMKSVDDALEVRGRIFGAFELAEVAPEAEREKWLTFVVVGAGPTGVEMAGQIAELAHRTLKDDFRSIDSRKARVILLDAAPKVLPAFGERLSRIARKELEKVGVEVQVDARVVVVDEDGIDFVDKSGRHVRIDSMCKMWAAGVLASSLGAQLADKSGAELDRAGRVLVEADCTLPGHPEVFVIGDMMSLDDNPGVAQVAMQAGRFAAATIIRRLHGDTSVRKFHYRDKGSMATIARFDAVASVGKIRISGFVAWLMWLGVHLLYLVGFKNRLTTLLHWTITFVGRGRSERTMTTQQVVARGAIKRLGAIADRSSQAG